MKVAIRTWLVLAVGAALWLSGCSDSHQNAFDKNTNWLRRCSDSNACGAGLQCVCGLCTSVCDRNAQCAEHAEGAVCVTPSHNGGACTASEASAATRVCSLACKSSDACADVDDGLMCVKGACELVRKGGADAGRDGSVTDDGGTDAGRGVLADDSGMSTPPDSGAVEVPTEVLPVVDPEVGAAIKAACGNGFVCEGRVAMPGSVKSIVAGDDGFIYWTDWGSLDDLGNHRKDGAIKRVSRTDAASTPEAVLSDLDKPWLLWLDTQRLYWLSGEPGDFGVGPGQHTLFESLRGASAVTARLKTDAFEHLHMHSGQFAWQTSVTVDGTPNTSIQRFNPHGPTDTWTEQPVPGNYVIDGLDDSGVYIEDGNLSILFMGFGGYMPLELVTVPDAFLVTVADDALWLIHSDKSDWVSSMPKPNGGLTQSPTVGGDVTHVGSGDGYYDAPQPGASVVWLVTGERGGSTWQLWSIPKSGGEREPALSWPTESGHVRDDAPAPIWIADGDDAWVFGHGALVRVRRP